jgi:hypothetical protein
MKAAPVKQNMIDTRVQAVESVLSQLYDGRPRLQISPNCRTLIAAMEGGYCYEKTRRNDTGELRTTPSKNRFSHLADAMQYLCLAMGEGRAMTGLTTPMNEQRGVNVWHRRAAVMRRVAGYMSERGPT